jgi:hypothetical protein
VRALGDWLWGEHALEVHAVLDGASVPGLLDRLYAAPRPRFVCLHRGELAPGVAQMAPYLVRLDRESELTQWVLGSGWGNHWGVFVRSSARLIDLRRHLRNLYQVYGPDLEPLRFRFYDPRVLRAFMPLAEPAQLDDLFGPVDSWVVEAEDPLRAITFTRAGTSVQSGERSLSRGRG